MRIVFIITALFTYSAHAAGYSETFDWIKNSVRYLPEAHFDGEFKRFFNQKNESFHEKYSLESNLNIDVAFFSVNNTFFLMCRGEMKGGFGKSPWGLLIHPYDVYYGATPTLEYRWDKLHCSSGIDHRCFHYTDQKPPQPIPYWNRCFIAINSPDRRIYPRSKAHLADTGSLLFNRFSWSASWGYYISEFFGLVQPINLMSLTLPNYRHQFDAAVRYGIVSWKSGILELTDKSMLGFKRNHTAYWMQETGVEALFARTTFDASLYARYTVDGGRFNSKDQLLEIGFAVTK